MAEFSIYLFGSPRIEHHGQRVVLNRRKTTALLTYLIVTGQPHSREFLAALLWPELDEVKARSNLRRELSGLRELLGEAALLGDRVEMGLHPEYEVWCDVLEFRRLLEAGNRNEGDENAVIANWQQAGELYTADFLTGFNLPDSPEFDDWQFYQREYFRQQVFELLPRLIARCCDRGEYERGIEYSHRWLSLDAWHEPAHRELMKCYAWAGRQAAALRQYEVCARLLAEDLGVEPEAETTAVFEAIRERQLGEGVKRRRGEPEPGRDDAIKSSGGVGNLPNPTTAFVGRELELAEIGALLADSDKRLLTVAAPGGMGKTRIALAGGTAVAAKFPDGVFFISLASVTTAEHLLTAVADGIDYQLSSHEPKKKLFRYLQQQHLLLILDNFEQLAAEAGLLSELLQAAPKIKILVTSRERLNLLGETVFWLGGLDWLERPEGVLSSAAQLFWQHTQLMRPDLVLQPGEIGAINQICQMVQGMPLALILAAGWVDVLSLEEIAAELRGGLDILVTDLVDVPERQRSIRVVFDSSWRRLSPEEQTVFGRLSVFCEGFSRQAAQAVAGVSLPVLRRLGQKLLVTGVENGRYHIVELLRQYGAEKLIDVAEAKTAHSAYYLGLVAQLEQDLRGKRQMEAVREISLDFENIRQAWFWAVDQGEETAVGAALESLHLFFEFGSRYLEGIEFLAMAERRFAPLPDNSPSLLWGRIAARLSLMRLLAEGDDSLETVVKECLTIAEQTGDQYEIALNLQTLGTINLMRNNLATCNQVFQQSLAYFRALQDTLGMSRVLNELHFIYEYHNGAKQAKAILQEALDLAQLGGHASNETAILSNLAELHLFSGHYGEAETYFERAYRRGIEAHRQTSIVYIEVMLGLVYFLRGEFVEAERLTQLAMGKGARYSIVMVQTMAAAILSIQATMREDYEVALQQGQVALLNPLNDRAVHILTHWAMALAYDGVGESKRTWHYLRKLGESVWDGGATAVYTWMLPITAHMLMEEGQWETAVHHLALAHEHPLSPTGWLEKWPRISQWRKQLQEQLGEARFQTTWQAGVNLNPETVLLETPLMRHA